MSDSEEAEYEVESVVAARVEPASRSKKAKLVWKYLVRWKGYSADDDTWEPIDSFEESEQLLEVFWKHSSTNGRDVNDMSLFRAGENFQLIGPPRRTRRSTGGPSSDAPLKASSEEMVPESPPSKAAAPTSEKRPRSPDIAEASDRPVKRNRQPSSRLPQLVASSSKPLSGQQTYGTRSKDAGTSISAPLTSRRRSDPSGGPSPEIIPDSDEENTGGSPLRMPSNVASKQKQPVREPRLTRATRKTPQKQGSPPIVVEDDSPSPAVRKPVSDQEVDEDPAQKVPMHRARFANPRVKLLDDSPLLSMEGNLSAKVRAVKSINAEASASASEQVSTRPRRSKPGPGRDSSGLVAKNTSSLLIAEKGGLKSVKGKYSKGKSAAIAAEPMEVDAPADVPPPTAEELLQMAGLNTESAEALSDFEDEPAGDKPDVAAVKGTEAETASAPSPKVDDEKAKAESLRKESLDLAKNNLFPQQTVTQLAPENMVWGKSTIFGPLSMGSTSEAPDKTMTLPLFLTLDSSVAIPIFVSETSVATQLYLKQKLGSPQVPGKFYDSETALSLLATIRATGQSAIITLANTAATEEKAQFDLFKKRLEDGEIFVAMAGLQILVLSSSSNTLLSSRLNAPANILNQPGKVLVSHVDVENYSGYAEAASKADPRRWTQYISTK